MKKLLLVISTSTLIFTEIPLFEQFPKLKRKVPHIQLTNLPSPIKKLDHLCKELSCQKIYIKDDGLLGNMPLNEVLFGGNKVRKLEFLLADAIQKGSKTVITYGCAGSNHCAATACYCKQLGLKCMLLLKGQPNSNIVKRNILLDLYYEAKLCYFPTEELRQSCGKYKIYKTFDKDGIPPYVIPTGGSNPLGVLGFINAAFELKKQITKGSMPEPDYIYLPIGSCGTTVGLIIGLNAAGLKTKIVPVGIEPENYEQEITGLLNKAKEFIKKLDPTFPLSDNRNYEPANMNTVGSEYGESTKECEDTIKLLQELEELNLDATYSAKAMAALIQDSKKGLLKDKVILFWNTFCGHEFEEQIEKTDINKIPKSLHRYF